VTVRHSREDLNSEVLVIGGGAAGLIAATRAADLGARVTLFEKNERLGMKILISGGGKCNLTHAGTMEELRSAFRGNEGRFLKPSFYRFTSDDFLATLHAAGMPTYLRPDGRIFPVEPHNAKDVVALLQRSARRAGVSIHTGAAVNGLNLEGGQALGARIGDREFHASCVILAVGGSSYPATGTTGDGWRWAAGAGHQIAPLRAALAPLYLENPMPEWSGVSLRGVALRARIRVEGREYARWRGDLLFTHKGLSGPCALGVSREIGEQMAVGLAHGGTLEVDLSPDEPFELVKTRLRAELAANPRRLLGSIADRYMPDRLAPAFLSATGIDPQTRGAHVTAGALNQFVCTLKGWRLGGVRSVPIDRGEVVAGGVSLDEVDPHTMQSRIIKRLFLCGEMLDIAGPVGGYNLQAAWSTGYVAGEAAAAAVLR